VGENKNESRIMKNTAKAQNSPRRVLFISALDLWSMGSRKGGPALWQTLKGYAEREWKVYFITGNRAHETHPEAPDNIHIIRFDARWLKWFFRIKKVGFFFKAISWFWFQLMAFVKALQLSTTKKIDLVYAYEIDAVPIAKFLSKLWYVPMISRFQGTKLTVSRINKRVWVLRAWQHLLGLKIPADLVIMTNDGTQGDKVLKILGVNMEHVRFWMNGVDWDAFLSMPTQVQARDRLDIDSNYVLLTVSRLVEWKRVERIIHALPKLIEDVPDSMLIVVGDGPERKKLQQLSQMLKVDHNVRFEGAIPHSKISEYFATADIFLSLYDLSNVGNPLLEAMMAGKCIITLNNGDTSRFISDGENGVLLEYHDLPRLPGVIKELFLDDNFRNRLGVSARKFAEDNFWSWKDRMEAEVQAVKGLL
jgi:glycosyltransferase involved in cell wall biosynthesis